MLDIPRPRSIVRRKVVLDECDTHDFSDRVRL